MDLIHYFPLSSHYPRLCIHASRKLINSIRQNTFFFKSIIQCLYKVTFIIKICNLHFPFYKILSMQWDRVCTSHNYKLFFWCFCFWFNFNTVCVSVCLLVILIIPDVFFESLNTLPIFLVFSNDPYHFLMANPLRLGASI
jgi:hypothetical protein